MAEKIIPMLSEHQSVANLMSTRPSGYTPDEQEKKTLKLVDKLFEKAKKHKAQYDEKWLDFYKMFRGRQWKEQRPSYRHSEVINMIFQNIQSAIPILTDSRPRFEFIPEEPSDRPLASILSHVAEADWIKNNWQSSLVEIIYESYFYGTGLGSMRYDPDANFGIGSIVFQSEDPFYCFPDPNATDVNKKGKYFISAEPVDVAEIKQRFPEKGKYVRADVIDLMHGSKTELDQVKFKSPVDNKTVLEGSSAQEIAAKDQALLITCYLKSDEIDEEKIDETNPDTSEVKTTYIQKLKYPKGRRIIVASGVVLDDAPMEYEDGKFPFAKLINYMLPREFWGMSEVEQLAGPQKIFNKLVSFALDVLTLMGNPIWIVDNTSGIDTDNLFNRPGLVVEKEPNSEVRRESGVQLQPYVLQLIDRMKSWFDDISGTNEVSRGLRPEGITAASAIQSLQDAAQQRLRLKSRHIDAFLQEVGQMYISRVFQFYSAPQVFRITNDQNAERYFKFHVETQIDETGQPILDERGNPRRVARIRDFVTGPDGNAALSEEQEFLVKGTFDVRVTTGSTLPFAKQEKLNIAFKYFEAGAIDEPELLKAGDYPNWEAVWERVQERRAQQAAAQGPVA